MSPVDDTDARGFDKIFRYFAETLEVIDAITLDAILKAAARFP